MNKFDGNSGELIINSRFYQRDDEPHTIYIDRTNGSKWLRITDNLLQRFDGNTWVTFLDEDIV